MEGWRDQSKWLLRLEDFEGISVGDSFESMFSALGRVALSKYQRELSSRGREMSKEPVALATTSTGSPRSVITTDAVKVGRKGKAMEETTTLSRQELKRCRRFGEEIVEEDIGVAPESDDQDRSIRQKKKKSRGSRRKVGRNTRAGGNSSKKSKGNSSLALSRPPADMPQEFMDRINRMGGKEVKVVIEKKLSQTDLDGHICRLSIPKNQVRDPSFLRDEEDRFLLERNAIDVIVIGPIYSKVLKFALVKMGSKNKANPSLIYNFRSTWNEFAKENKLKERDKIQIRSFRVDSDELCFVLIKLDNDAGEGSGDGGDEDSKTTMAGVQAQLPAAALAPPGRTSLSVHPSPICVDGSCRFF